MTNWFDEPQPEVAPTPAPEATQADPTPQPEVEQVEAQPAPQVEVVDVSELATADADADHDDATDVPLVIEEHIGDGPGDIDTDNPPESDFVSFSEPDVEKEDGE